MRARDIMVRPVHTAGEEATLEELAELMVRNGIGCVPIVDRAGRMKGVVTETDFVAQDRGVPFTLVRAPRLLGQWLGPDGAERIYAEARQLPAREVMTRGAVTIEEDDSLEEVLEQMLRHDIAHLPVVREGVPVGMVARHDLLRLMLCSAAGITAPCLEDTVPTAVSGARRAMGRR